MVVDSFISAAKVCDFRMVLTGRTQVHVCGCVVELLRQNILCQP